MPLSKLSILFVDDDPDLLSLLKESVQPYFSSVYTANSVDQAIAQLSASEVDIVVSDLNMPDKDGLELRKKMNSDFPKTKFLMFTGFSEDSKLTEALSKDNFHVIEKPADPQVLLDKIKSIL